MRKTSPEDEALDPFAWATIGQSPASLDDIRNTLSQQLSRVVDLQSIGLVSGLKLPEGHRPQNGLPFPEPDLRSGDFVNEAWTDYSIKHGDQDPLPQQIGPSGLPIWLYDGSSARRRLEREHAPYFQALDEHGFESGVFLSSLSLDRRSVEIAGVHFGASAREIAPIERSFSRQIQLAFAFFSEGRGLRSLMRDDAPFPRLSPRELECLVRAAAGESSRTIAERLKLADATVNEYFASASRKLGAVNRNQACARAVLLGLVAP